MQISKGAVLEQLTKIVSSKLFSESYKLKRFLKYVVLETVEDRSDQLKQYNIAMSAFDRTDDFDPNKDPIVRIQAGRLRTSLSVYYGSEGKNDPILIHIPTGTYRPIIELKKELETVSSTYQDDVIGVEAFKNLSEGNGNQYIGAGFKEELLLELARYDHLSIIRLSNEKLSNVEQRFARFIIRGSIRTTNTRIKLVIHVEDRKTMQSIWVKNFELPFDPQMLIDSQEKIAKTVANKVGDVLGGVVFDRLLKESRNKKDLKMIAYEALLRFYYYQKAPVEERYVAALDITKKVLDSDPENGVCWALLSTLAIDSIALDWEKSNKEGLQKALDYALKAVKYEPSLQITRTHLSYAYLMNNKFSDANEQAEIALAYNPNAAFFVGSLGWLMALAGSWKKGLGYIEEGIYLNPGYPVWYHQASCFYYLGIKDFDRALIEANKLNISDLFWDPLLKTVCYALLGQEDKAGNYAKLLLQNVPTFIEEGEALIKMYVKEDLHFKKITEGLTKAGISLLVEA